MLVIIDVRILIFSPPVSNINTSEVKRAELLLSFSFIRCKSLTVSPSRVFEERLAENNMMTSDGRSNRRLLENLNDL